MKYCSRCLYPENHPLGIMLDEKGVCSGCRIHEEKDALDWSKRMQILVDIVEEYKSTKRGIHDCIVPVSGGRDSFFTVHVVKNILKLNPLLVSYNKLYNTQCGINNLSRLRTVFGCDFIQQTVTPDRVKKITRDSLRLRGSMYWHCLAGQTVFPVQIAVKFRIPLIIWGAHQGIDQVGMFSHLDEVEMTRKYRKDHDLMGLEAEDLARLGVEASESDVEPFVYPHDRDIAEVGVRGIYLNNYMRWDSKAQHEFMLRQYGFETRRLQRTFDTYNDQDCFHYTGLHDYIKYLKCGYGKCTDHACREIRLKRLNREEGMALVEKYSKVQPADESLFLEWLGISSDELFEYINAFRDPRIWNKLDSGEWVIDDSICNHAKDTFVEEVRLKHSDMNDFIETPDNGRSEAKGKYIIIGRGWAD